MLVCKHHQHWYSFTTYKYLLLKNISRHMNHCVVNNFLCTLILFKIYRRMRTQRDCRACPFAYKFHIRIYWTDVDGNLILVMHTKRLISNTNTEIRLYKKLKCFFMVGVSPRRSKNTFVFPSVLWVWLQWGFLLAFIYSYLCCWGKCRAKQLILRDTCYKVVLLKS